jgi:outer membrane protein assembly factor BamB
VIWSRDAASHAGVKVLTWGFSSSPLVVNDMVIVALSGKLAAYDTVNGNSRWFGPDGGSSYSSPHLLTINGISQVILMSHAGAISVEPESGKKLWEYPWPIDSRILQPALLENGDLLLCSEMKDMRRIAVSKEGDGFKITECWTLFGINFFFNDLVIHKGYAYGFDGPSIVCIDLKDGKRMWKGDRYRGWLLLLEDQDLLLVLTEKGELALVQADPNKFTELSHFPAIKGKTWNHPILVGDILVVRNAQEMAAFRLSLMNKES